MFLIEDQEFKKRSAIDWTRVKRDREGGQPKPPYWTRGGFGCPP